MAIKDWPAGERPREKLLALGPQALSEAELLAVFLRTGIAGRDILEIARDALHRFKGLNGLLAAARSEVEELAGFGPAKYAQLAAVVELARRALREDVKSAAVLSSPQRVREYLGLSLGRAKHEIFAVLFLDAQNRLIEHRDLFHGTLTQTSVLACVPLVPGIRLRLKSLKPHEFPNLPKNLGELIRRRRKTLRLTLDQLSADLGVNVGTLGEWERGHEKPYPRMIPRILEFLGIPADAARLTN